MIGNKISDDEKKAGYNQSGRITEVLGNLRITFISSMMDNDFQGSLEAIRGILNVISWKASEDDIKVMNEIIYEIGDMIPYALLIKITEAGKKVVVYPRARKETKINIENLYRKLEKLQDKYGYGMVSAEDPRLAVLKR